MSIRSKAGARTLRSPADDPQLQADRRSTFQSSVDEELKKVEVERKAALQARYETLFGRKPPKAFGPDLLRRSVAYRLQESAYGGLPKLGQKMLDKLIAALLAVPAGKLDVPRQAQRGVVLVREWKGKSYHVAVVGDGFIYNGRAYLNLSEIAREITGTRWNGPRFFGLRKETATPTTPLSNSTVKSVKGSDPSLREAYRGP